MKKIVVSDDVMELFEKMIPLLDDSSVRSAYLKGLGFHQQIKVKKAPSIAHILDFVQKCRKEREIKELQEVENNLLKEEKACSLPISVRQIMDIEPKEKVKSIHKFDFVDTVRFLNIRHDIKLVTIQCDCCEEKVQVHPDESLSYFPRGWLFLKVSTGEGRHLYEDLVHVCSIHCLRRYVHSKLPDKLSVFMEE